MSTTANERDETPERLKAKNPVEFLAQVRQEGRRVTWATRNEVWVSTVMVMIMVVAAIVFFWAVDWVLALIVSNFIVPQN